MGAVIAPILWFTPTVCGDNVCDEIEYLESTAVHPHGCGENESPDWMDALDVEGSPPLM